MLTFRRKDPLARFIFKLEAVLKHRERIEQDRQRDLAMVQSEMVRLQQELRGLHEEVQTNIADLRGQLVGKLNMAHLAAHRRYMLAMQRKIQNTSQQVAVQQQQVEKARRALAEATMQKNIIEKLRERQLERWQATQTRLENGALDELSTQLSYRDIVEQAEVTS